MKFSLFSMLLLVSPFLWAQSLVIVKDRAPVVASPSTDAPPVTYVKRGQKFKANGQMENGFYSLKTKSGRKLYILSEYVSDASLAEEDLVEAEDKSPRQASPPRENFDRLTYDLGLSTGSVGDHNYTEAQLGLNFFFRPWVAWRNAVFARFIDGDNDYGLDTSLRLIGRADLDRGTGITVFGGPGYRFPSEADSVPFGEAGLVIRFVGFSLGGGMRTFFNDWVRDGAENDNQFFIILSGSGSL